MNDATAGFAADPDRLAAQGGQFDDLVGRVGRIHRTLADALSESGECWGADAVGRSFGAVHATPADGTLSQLSALTERLGGVGTRFVDTGAAYTAADDGAIERLRAAGQDG
ncbi:hypothetical protein [Actinophytocola sediminis]